MSDDENDYGDDFEDEFETSGALSPSKHHHTTEKNDIARKSTEHHHVHMQLETGTKEEAKVNKPPTPRATSSYSDEYNPDDEEESNEDGKPSLLEQMGGEVDLESYLKNMLSSPVAANEGDEDNDDDEDKHEDGGHVNKELQPLVGVQPEDEDQMKLQAKLGYSPDKPLVKPGESSEFSTAALLSQPRAAGMNPAAIIQQLREQQQATQPRQSHDSLVHSSSGGDHVSQLLAMAAPSKSPQNAGKSASEGTDVENALKVDALLRDLFPDRYKDKETPVASSITKSKGKKKKKDKQQPPPVHSNYHPQHQYGLGAPRLSKATHYDEDDEEENEDDDDLDIPHTNKATNNVRQSSGGDLLGGLETQLKMLKKELKGKDEKIQRLTEHAMMMGNQMDKMRGEIARLNARLHEAQMELETKDARLLELHRKKKKESKKKQEQHLSDGSVIGQSSVHGVYEGEIVRLREREQALMDAVEELSSQNEDLIIKLRESMQRELELSSQRAQLVSHTIIGANGGGSAASMLPSIHEKHGHASGQGMLRAQTEPSLTSSSSNNGGNHHNQYHQQDFPVKPTGKKKKKQVSG